jgi:ATP-binding protein involved in chromosome partitioning
MALTQEQVMAALRSVEDPELLRDVVALGMVKDVQTEGPQVRVVLEQPSPNFPMRDKLEGDVKAALWQAGAQGDAVVW